MRWKIALLVGVAALAAGPAHALNERAWLLVGGGAAAYGMSDLNEELRAFNATYGSGGLTFDMIEKGPALGLAVGFETSGRWNFGLGVDRMFATTTASTPTAEVRYQFTANGWRAFAEYALRPIGKSALRLGFGAGVIGESGKITITQAGYTPSEPSKLSGAAPLYEAYAGGDLWLTPIVAISGASGYRYAKLGSVNTDGYEYDSQIDGTPVSIDFSGPYVRLGLKFVSSPGD